MALHCKDQHSDCVDILLLNTLICWCNSFNVLSFLDAVETEMQKKGRVKWERREPRGMEGRKYAEGEKRPGQKEREKEREILSSFQFIID